VNFLQGNCKLFHIPTAVSCTCSINTYFLLVTGTSMATTFTEQTTLAILSRLETIEERLEQCMSMLEKLQNGTSTPENEICDFERAREILGCGKKIPSSTLYSYTSRKLIPHHKDRSGRRLYFRRSDLEAFALAHRISSEGELQARTATENMKRRRR
jgi:hypothetical protein